MNHYFFFISTLIFLSLFKTLYGDAKLYTAGRDADVVDSDRYGRKWISLEGIINTGKGWVAQAITDAGLIDQTPYFHAVLSYTLYSLVLPVKNKGRQYVRLYFYTNNYHNDHIVRANFSVMANDKVLLDFPKPSVHLDARYPGCLKYEYSVPVQSDNLILLLAPDYKHEGSIAFINGIEVVSHPDIYSGTAILVGEGKRRKFVIDKQASLETIARLNVGGEKIDILDDSGKLFRVWDTDEGVAGYNPGIRVDASAWNTVLKYPNANVSKYVAPKPVYRTGRVAKPNSVHDRMMWTIPVEHPKYYYFVRLHFCEVMRKLKVNDRVFSIHINGYLAEKGADVVAWTGKPGIPVYKDYVVFVPKSEQPQVRIVLTPDRSSHKYDTLLNGIEIFKVSDHNGDLDVSFNPFGKTE